MKRLLLAGLICVSPMTSMAHPNNNVYVYDCSLPLVDYLNSDTGLVVLSATCYVQGEIYRTTVLWIPSATHPFDPNQGTILDNP